MSVVLAELLRFIAANEDLPNTRVRYPGYNRDTLGKLINAAADRVEFDSEAANGAATGKKSRLKVRKVSEVEKAAALSAEELDAAMNESKVDRERKREERKVAAKAEEAAVRAAAAAPAPRTRLYCDGAARGNPGPAGAGAVIINPGGHIVAKVGKYLGDNTNNFAEYMGLLLGLKRAKAMGIRDLQVLSDSELMIRQLDGTYQVKADNLRPLYDEAKTLLKFFENVDLQHIPREENEAADQMSNRAIDEKL